MLLTNTPLYRLIMAFFLAVNLAACTQETEEADAMETEIHSNTIPTKQLRHEVDTAGVKFNQPNTQFKSLSEQESPK